MDSPIAERKLQPDPYEIYEENMQRLKVVAMMDTASRSAPNSPMLRRGRSDTHLGSKQQAKHLLSPLPASKPVQLENGTFSKSLTELPRGRNRSLSPSPHRHHSPGQSPVGSPGGVSDRIIRAHFLANTTGKPGSYLLRRSEEIVKKKVSPQGSMTMLASPSLEQKSLSPSLPRKLPPLDNNPKGKRLNVPARPAAIVISPATEEPVIGFAVSSKDAEPDQRAQQVSITMESSKQKLLRKPVQPASTGDSSTKASRESPKKPCDLGLKADIPKQDSDDDNEEGDVLQTFHLTHVRRGIGRALEKPTLPDTTTEEEDEILPGAKTGGNSKGQQRLEAPASSRKPATSPPQTMKKHHYIKYGSTEREPRLLTPPKEPRGSKDLSAELEKIFREKKGRKTFDDLDHVDEHSQGTNEEDHDGYELEKTSTSEDEDGAEAAKKPTVAFTMPPVFESIPAKLQARDYEAPLQPIDTEFNPEEWKQIKKCRYIRKEHNSESEDEEDDFADISSDSEGEAAKEETME